MFKMKWIPNSGISKMMKDLQLSFPSANKGQLFADLRRHSFCHSLIQSVTKYQLRVYYMPVTERGAKDISYGGPRPWPHRTYNTQFSWSWFKKEKKKLNPVFTFGPMYSNTLHLLKASKFPKLLILILAKKDYLAVISVVLHLSSASVEEKIICHKSSKAFLRAFQVCFKLTN